MHCENIEIEEMDIKESLTRSGEVYAPYTVVARAIPEIDGLKWSQRRTLYTMLLMKLKTRTKCANIVGRVMELHPHGDSYPTLVRMTQGNNSLLHPLIDSKGTFGKVYSRDLKASASRYTESKLSELSGEFFKDLNKNVVDFIPNYDGKLQEPKILPVTFPNILCNPSKGIAFGMASSIIPLNMMELNKGIIDYLKTGDVKEIKNANFDFPTGGYLLFDKLNHDNIMETGIGKITLRAKYTVLEDERKIEINEIPYNTDSESIIEKILDLCKSKKIKDISDIHDETGLKGLGITIDYTRGTDPHILMNKLFKLTPLQTTMTANMNIITLSGRPKVLGVLGIVDEWLTFRRQCITRGLVFDLNASEEKLHILNGLNKILLDIDKTVEIISGSDSDDISRKGLIEYFDIDEIQANVVLDISLRKINKSYIQKKTKETSELIKFIKELQFKIDTPSEIDNIIINQLTEINEKYGIPRKTEIVYEYENVAKIEVIEEYPVNVVLTNQGYIKKSKSTATGTFRLKDDDFIIKTIKTNNKSDLFLLTSLGTAHRIPLHTMNTVELNNLGEYINNLIQFEENETLVDIFCIDDYSKGYVMYAYKNKIDNKGKIAKIDVDSFSSIQNKKKFANCLNLDSELLSISYVSSDCHCGFVSSNGRLAIIDTSKIMSKKSKKSQGVVGMKIDDGCEIVQAFVGAKESSAIEIFTTNDKHLRHTLSDKYDENFGGRNYFQYFLSGSASAKGSYIHNFGKNPKGHKISKVIVDL